MSLQHEFHWELDFEKCFQKVYSRTKMQILSTCIQNMDKKDYEEILFTVETWEGSGP